MKGHSDENVRPMSRRTRIRCPLCNVWNGRWWAHVRYCSAHCEALHELERYNARTNRGRHAFIPGRPG